MVSIKILKPKLLSETTSSQAAIDHFTRFQKKLKSLIDLWRHYQPKDALSTLRKQDLEWLISMVEHYRLRIHASSYSLEFWQGYRQGKKSRRTIPASHTPSLAPILEKALKPSQSDRIYALGVRLGWCYDRLKNYLLRITKEQKLKAAKQLKNSQPILSVIQEIQAMDNTDSLVSLGRLPERRLNS
ncbi:hypothetical protein [Planktothrix paucivesiculata]|jgi:hypothetical protein|uniref:Uncharacterized protein n=1 Tax=Planktothrix paucivesiculata PCC 9631 TaxID=671071 RepID=A0A7Z9DZ26_9CYAN|nr:hypothetical protein [Planktothrix paucivesiculata]VXD16961.1 hypothetical protein PL9631_250120 [Planktothrix paucivesiculata PCC 9631]